MVSVRRGTSRQHVSSSSPARTVIRNCCTLKNVILIFIGLQAVNLVSKISTSLQAAQQQRSSSSSSDTTQQQQQQQQQQQSSSLSLVDVLHKKRRQEQDDNRHHRQHDLSNLAIPKGLEIGHHHNKKGNKNNNDADDDDNKREEEHNIVDDDEVTTASTTSRQQNKPSQQLDVLTKHGSGPARLGYVVDLVQERQQADFRTSSLQELLSKDYYRDRVNQVARQLGLSKNSAALQPCEYVVQNNNNNKLLLQHAHCRDPDTTILTAFNSAPFARYYCGHEIAPGTALKLDHHDQDDNAQNCVVVPHVFAETSTIPDHVRQQQQQHSNVPAIVVRSSTSSQRDSQNAPLPPTHTIECDIPCEFESSTNFPDKTTGDGGVHEFFIQGTTEDWKLIASMDDPYYQTQAKMEPTNYKRNIYYSTTSLSSSVPLSFYNFATYDYFSSNTHSLKVSWEQAHNKATYLVDRDCNTGRRPKWFAAVNAAFPVEAYGHCQHNTDLNQDETIGTMPGRIQLMQKNRIVLVLEAGNEKDHITEAVWEALMSGSVPAILGATNLHSRLPNRAAIYANSFNNWDTFASYVKQVSENKTLWESYHTWRTDPTERTKFVNAMRFTQTTPECRTCRWAYAKRYGLGWNHTQQVVQENHIPRTLCTSSSSQTNVDKLVTKPFREVWVTEQQQQDAKVVATGRRLEKDVQETCTTPSSVAEIETDGYTIEREVIEHDGVVDMTIKRIDQHDSAVDIVLRLEIDGVRNTDGAYFRDTHTLVKDTIRTAAVSSASIQDDKSKVTVLANWVTEIRSPQEGVIEVVVKRGKDLPLDADEIRRIRVITEDMSELHDKMTEFYPSSYGKLMTHDFIDPLELFYEA